MNQPTIPPVQFDEKGFALSYGWAQVYRANTVTREYVGARVERTSEGLSLSAGAYLDEPTLPPLPDMTIFRTVDDKSWEYVPDYCGKMAYRTQTRQPVEITEIGDIAVGLTFLAPQTPFDNWDGKQWVTDVQKVQQLRVQDAEQQKRQFLWTAREKIDIWQDAVDLGIATDAEKAALLAWKKYRVLLNRVDCTTAPDIAWPEQPK